MNSAKYLRAWCLLCVCALGPAAIAGAEPKTLDIAFIAPLTGEQRRLGRAMADAAQDAVMAINESGVYPVRIALRIEDDACDAERARAVAQALIDRYPAGDVDVAIGHCPELAHRVAPLYGQARVPLVVPLAGSDPRFPEVPYGTVFRVDPPLDELAQRLIEVVEKRSFPAARVAIVGDESPFSERLGEILAGGLERRDSMTLPLSLSSGRSSKWEASIRDLLGEFDPDLLIATHGRAKTLRAFIGALEPFPVETIVVRRSSMPEQAWLDALRQASWRSTVKVFGVLADPSEISRVDELYWDHRPRGWAAPPPPLDSLVLAAFQITVQAQLAASEGGREFARSMRDQVYRTGLGRLRSGEIGQLRGVNTAMLRTRDYSMQGESAAPESRPPASIRPPAAVIPPEPEIEPPPPEQPQAVAPLYNLEIEPLTAKRPIVLEADEPTRLTFYLGSQAQASVLGAAAANPLIPQLAAGRPLALNVTLNCLICDRETYQRASLVYDPVDNVSPVRAEFHIVPRAERVDAVTGMGKLIFTVDMSGIDLDVIDIAVFLEPPTAEQAAAYPSPSVRRMALDLKLKRQSPDLVIDIATSPGKLPIGIAAIHAGLQETLREALDASDTATWTFESGLTKSDLEGLVADAYLGMRQIVDQAESALQPIYAHELSTGAAHLDLDADDRARILNTLRRHGARIYGRLLLRGERRLRTAVDAIEDFADRLERPLRLRIRSTDVYAPWQILYPESHGEIDAEAFWGFRYALGTMQLVDAAQSNMTFRTVLGKPAAEETLFAAWRGSAPGETDNVAERASLLKTHLGRKLGATITPIQTRERFLDRLHARRSTLLLIFAYGHASSGATILETEAGPVMVPSTTGIRFQFSDQDWVVPGDIDDLLLSLDPALETLFSSQPIVILNACETSGVSTLPANNNGFVGALARSGARAVIVTDAPVWNNFAYHFGKDLIDEIFTGAPLQSALLNVRLHHLNEWNNPLGLVYALYGNQAAYMDVAH